MRELGDHRVLFEALISVEHVQGLVTNPDDAVLIAERLRPLRDCVDFEIRSLSSNGERVDVVANGGDTEWRVVFATPDGRRVDWLHVYERPLPFTGVAGGRAVVVNGPSSSGKSSVVAAIRARGDMPWVVFDEPMFGDVQVEYLIWPARSEALHRGFLEGIAQLARAGNCVAMAAGGHAQAMFDAAFVGVPMIRVGLDCSAEELARRERGRRDVPGGLAESSLQVHTGWHYHLRFDTTVARAAEIADVVLQEVERQCNSAISRED